MLNRRILRVKAMQALYSYFTARESLKEVVREKLESQFYPDPAKDDFSESDKFTERRKLASKLFNENLPTRKVQDTKDVEDDVVAAVNAAIELYYKELLQERRTIKKDMLDDIEDINKLYLKLMILPVEIAHIEKLEREKKQKAYIHKESPWKWHFTTNPVIDELTKFEDLNKAIIDQKVSWDTDQIDQLKTWYKDILRKDEEVNKYQTSESPTAEDHKEIILHFFKKIIFKNESVGEYLSEMDLRWSENKPILKSLIAKTFQDYEEELEPPFELKSVSKNAEEDMEFFNVMFDETLAKSSELDALIEKKIKNWDISRVAMTDRIILKMAITEMMQFHSIPTKVTINEFIEISKQYSTPKSKQFVNGILDVLANELTSDGVIRKSGRGLIDNK
ncbi:MAG: transcription antitermination factor NusB [Flammeovirgaceae bacterium]|nr:transcription antitermination factor NusB [Flammeovirgaceae bacterium]MBE61491.1 transcription antitermination factor NusB [Flammeovirgaceae bacterium]MBR06210.1 transcription antitermination factor NusB [Rickettsiales bacterium]HCX20368.1 transcription antitermination factor NusB [Cytophagales bacterium]|tara:strand:- start:2253 stop:3431 length:1179 start_codon:yes stop_codon:yes gene_type:complete